jgi:hypothetical protein
MMRLWLAASAALTAFFLIAPLATAEPPDDGPHLGVASCSSANCHGSPSGPIAKSVPIPQDEFTIWHDQDKHRKAYDALTSKQGERIAAILHPLDAQGKPTEHAEQAEICLDCHTDNAAQHGPLFSLKDGVGCEACHGGASKWLGVHLSPEQDQSDPHAYHLANIKAGLYPTDDPEKRAQLCDRCHVAKGKDFIVHRIMGAGHPPIDFELVTYTAREPPHFNVNASYIRRKGQPNDLQIWAVGQAVDLMNRSDALLDPKNAPKGAVPELSLFDCQACHHATTQLQWTPSRLVGLGPGQLRLRDTSAVMLQVIAARVAPDVVAALRAHIRGQQPAVAADWPAVQREAQAMQTLSSTLLTRVAAYQFGRTDARALAAGVIALGVDDGELSYTAARQETMALQAIIEAMDRQRLAEPAQVERLKQKLAKLSTAIANDQAYRPEPFKHVLQELQRDLPP